MGKMKSIFGGFAAPPVKRSGDPVAYENKTGFEHVDTEVLRNLWMVKFESRVVTMKQLYDVRSEDINMVAQELHKRGHVCQEVFNSPAKLEPEIFYILEKEQYGDH